MSISEILKDYQNPPARDGRIPNFYYRVKPAAHVRRRPGRKGRFPDGDVRLTPGYIQTTNSKETALIERMNANGSLNSFAEVKPSRRRGRVRVTATEEVLDYVDGILYYNGHKREKPAIDWEINDQFLSERN